MGLILWRNARLATLAGREPWGLIDRGALLADGELLRWVGRESDLGPGLDIEAEHDLGGALVTPGLVDAHTHLVYGGQRASEFELRLHGASYEQIAKDGGGIRSTVAATRAASEDGLFASAATRLDRLVADGVTTVEIKSGYGLAFDSERRCLRVARRLGRERGISVRTTCLAAHALPPEFDGRADDYIGAVCEWLAPLQSESLIDAVDAYCERIAFSIEQTARLFERSRTLGLPVKLHAEQFSDSGGAVLAARYRALSCDHLEYLAPDGVAAMAASGSVAVLLPGAFYFLRETRLPPVDALRRAGVAIALATDHNPGTSPTLSLRLMLNMACTLFRLTPEEAVRGATVNGARALGLTDRGRLAEGLRADFAAWDLEHPAELAYWLGGNPCLRVVCGGAPMRSGDAPPLPLGRGNL
ncbi:MAG TPA: imidazolonepropionase [Burkholderiaceae bacterium]|nr:imidazolonepropionase [Burkholderiaceae bacterium]